MFVLLTDGSAVIFLRTTTGIERFRRIDGSPERLRRAVESARAIWSEGAFGPNPSVFGHHPLKPIPRRGILLRLLR